MLTHQGVEALSKTLRGFTEGLTSLVLCFLIMSDFQQYEFTIKVKTNHDPRQAIYEIVQQLKGVLPVTSIEYHLIEDRPTSDEHHGGVTDAST